MSSAATKSLRERLAEIEGYKFICTVHRHHFNG
jgi:hypothetical protein